MAKKKGHYTQHPCVYIDDFNKPHLVLFRNFFRETSLPKYQKMDEDTKAMINTTKTANYVVNVTEDSDSSMSYTSDIIPSWNSRITTDNTSPYGYERSMEQAAKSSAENKPSTFQKFKNLFRKKKSIEKAFQEIKDSMKIPRTEDFETIVSNLEKLYKFLKESGQFIQAEKIEQYGNILAYEMAASKNGIQKYLLEEDIINLMLKSDKGISITFLRYFSNILPMSVSLKKMDIDKLKIFDNYAVLYYDPGVDVFRYHEETFDDRLARDPILFGLIDGSNKLYYICDWIYQDDDLTMEKVEKVIGRQSRLLVDAQKHKDKLMVDDAIKDLYAMVDAIRTANAS